MVKRFMAPGPWITRDLKECVRASDYDALAAERDALRKDAERYRWLRDQFRLLNADMGGNHAWSFGHIARLRGPSVDAAIDAAMGERP